MNDDIFFDSHAHLMTMAHPDLTAFAARLGLDRILALNTLPLAGALFAILGREKTSRVMNLLSLMDRGIGECLLAMEELDLAPLMTGGSLIAGERAYSTVALCPLMMDFGLKGGADVPGAWYGRRPHKAIRDQVDDLFTGIAEYCRRSTRRYFQFYPFMGLNTRNYSLRSGDGHTGLVELLEKHFAGFEVQGGDARRRLIAAAASSFSGEVETMGPGHFAGVKVYPPLGFDPWPDDAAEREKTEYLYSFCAARRIPITTHCGSRGYSIVSAREREQFTAPERWLEPLRRHPDLTLNFAHLGGSIDRVFINARARGVARLMLEHERVYADTACLCFDEDDYRAFAAFLERLFPASREHALARILFGSDFIINLLWAPSYQAYLKACIRTRVIFGDDADWRHRWCAVNPRRFLFGEE